MERLPNIDIQEDLEIINNADIKQIDPIIEKENLNEDPFIRAPPLTDFKKKASSEKQKAHLANARKLAKEQKEKIKLEKAQAKENEEQIKKEKEINKYVETKKKEEEQKITHHDKDPFKKENYNNINDFDYFLENMTKYEKIMKRKKELDEIKRLESEIKEQELEEKYFKKFQEKKDNEKNNNKKST